jgi:hypothetical protein
MNQITGQHQLEDTSIAAKSGKNLLSGQPCGTGTCDNSATLLTSIQTIDIKLSDFTDDLTKKFGVLY